MQYTDSVTKGFLTGKGTFLPRRKLNLPGQNALETQLGISLDDELLVSRWSSYQDPTYLGFYLKFNVNTIADPNNQDLDYLPQGLFLGAKAAHPQLDTSGASPSTNNEHPDSAVNYLQRRGEYYRAAMMKEFREGMIYMAENEPWVFEKVSGLADLWKIDPGKNFRAKDKKITLDCNDSLSLRITYLADLYRKAAYDVEYARHMLPETQRYFSMSLVVTDIRTLQRNGEVFEPNTFLEFNLDFCEFDFSNEGGPQFLGDLSTFAGSDGGKVKVVIKVGRIREFNSYGLLGGVLSDTFSPFSRGKAAATGFFSSDTTVENGEGSQLLKTARIIAGFKNTTHRQNLTGALGRFSGIADNLIGRAFLGNVYGLSPASLLSDLQALQQDPFNTIASVVKNLSLPQDVSTLSSKVELSGPEVNILKDFIGSLETISSIVAGTSLESLSLGQLIQSAEASENLIGTLGNLAFPDTPKGEISPAKQERTGIGSLDGLLSKVLLEGSGSIEGAPASQELVAPPVGDSPSPSNVDLESAPTETNGGGKVNLEGPPVGKLTQSSETLEGPDKNSRLPKSADLTAPPVSNNISSAVELESNTATSDGNLSSVELEGNRSTIDKAINAATDISRTDPSQDLEGFVGKVKISENPSDRLEKDAGSIDINVMPSQELQSKGGEVGITEKPSQNLQAGTSKVDISDEPSENLEGPKAGNVGISSTKPSQDLENPDLGNVGLE